VTIIGLLVASLIGWLVSSLAAGGSPLILIPVLSLVMEAKLIPPIITIGMLIGNSQRVGLYWQSIDWELTSWYLPGGIVGAIAGAFLFTQLQLEWLSLLLGLFLITSIFSYRLANQLTVFQIKKWQFLPAGFIYAFLSGLIGSTGPILNPLYLNYGLKKESLIATKSIHVLVIHYVKLIAYGAFGALSLPILGYGIIIGIGAFPGNWLGLKILERMEEQQFRQLVFAFVVFSGIMFVWEQRDLFSLFIY